MAPFIAVVAGAAILTIIAVKLLPWLYQFIVLRQKVMELEGEPHHWLWGHVNVRNTSLQTLFCFMNLCTRSNSFLIRVRIS